MNIYCQLCNFGLNTRKELSYHIRDKHKNYTTEKYYYEFILKDNEDICSCGNKKKFINIVKGFKQTCGHSCGCKLFRKELKNNTEKYSTFCEKVVKNQERIWNEREVDGTKDVILKKIGEIAKATNKLLSSEEKMKKYSIYYTCKDFSKLYEIIEKRRETCYKNIKSEKIGYHKNMKGLFKPKNPKKYLGNVKQIIFRSSYEFKYMSDLDNDPSVIEWSSEEYFVRYYSIIDKKWHRYFPDMIIKKKKGNLIETLMIEIKPAYQTKPPIKSPKMTKGYIKEAKTWIINKTKWETAEEHCKAKGWKFVILTEKELGLR